MTSSGLTPEPVPACFAEILTGREHVPARARPSVTQQRAVVDSSGWIELFTDRPVHSEAQAIQAAAVMQRGLLVDLDSRLAIVAAQLSHVLRLPMADSIILATARAHQARLYTLNADFKDLHDVELMQRP